ncbi:hypothetical protein [Nannocystis pusilla]|uniref:hypothetical protein n=1 Tax=Nannocystis pusilla TaxID=889268 RepID=UPI003DA22DC9
MSASIKRPSTISLDSACDARSTAANVEPLDQRLAGRHRRAAGPQPPRQQLDLAARAPAVVQALRLAGVRRRDRGKPAALPEAPCQLVGHRLELHEAVLAGAPDRPLVQALGRQLAPLQAGQLRLDQRHLAAERLRRLLGPQGQLGVVRRHALDVIAPVADRRVGQRGVQVELGLLVEPRRHVEALARPGGHRHGLLVALAVEAALELADPPEHRQQRPRVVRVAEAALLGGLVAAERRPQSPDQVELGADQLHRERRAGLAGHAQRALGLAQHLGQRRARGHEEADREPGAVGRVGVAARQRRLAGPLDDRVTGLQVAGPRDHVDREHQQHPRRVAVEPARLDQVGAQPAEPVAVAVRGEARAYHAGQQREGQRRAVGVAVLEAEQDDVDDEQRVEVLVDEVRRRRRQRQHVDHRPAPRVGHRRQVEQRLDRALAHARAHALVVRPHLVARQRGRQDDPDPAQVIAADRHHPVEPIGGRVQVDLHAHDRRQVDRIGHARRQPRQP